MGKKGGKKMRIEWEARWSGGMKETAVLIRVGEVLPQRAFARHICHIRGGSELYRAEVAEGETVLHLYLSGSGKTERVEELFPGNRKFDSWDEAEQALTLPEGSLEDAFWC